MQDKCKIEAAPFILHEKIQRHESLRHKGNETIFLLYLTNAYKLQIGTLFASLSPSQSTFQNIWRGIMLLMGSEDRKVTYDTRK